jgi:hypothetical protein
MLANELVPYGQWLLGYAQEAATQSVRARDHEELRAGFTALALERGQNDYRDVLVTLPLLAHSAEKLGASADTHLQEAMAIAPSPTRQLIREFLNRSPDDRRIEVMGYREGTSTKGFVYKQIRRTATLLLPSPLEGEGLGGEGRRANHRVTENTEKTKEWLEGSC